MFIPHRGCPHQCVFCNQTSITGGEPSVIDAAYVRASVESFVTQASPGRRSTEIAFFGGNFLGLADSVIVDLLSVASEYVKKGWSAGLRFSTRPGTKGWGDATDSKWFFTARRGTLWLPDTRLMSQTLGPQFNEVNILGPNSWSFASLFVRTAVVSFAATIGPAALLFFPDEVTGVHETTVATLFCWLLAAQASQSTWSYYTMLRFGWDERGVGLSLAAAGVTMIIVQGWLTRRAMPALGERRAALLGFGAGGLGLLLNHLFQRTFAVAKEAGASVEEMQEAAAIAMTVNATRIRNAFNSMAAASGIAPAPGRGKAGGHAILAAMCGSVRGQCRRGHH